MADLRENAGALGMPLIIGAVAFGLVAAALSYVYLKSEKAALFEQFAGRGGEQITVLVAGQDLPRGTVLRQEVLSQRNIPSGYAPNDVVLVDDFERYLGLILEVDVGAGKPIARSYVDTGFPKDFSDTIAVGRRALTVQVDEINSVGGFIRPGNRIDLFVNIAAGLSGFASGFLSAEMIDAIPASVRQAIPEELLDIARGTRTGSAEVEQLVAESMPKDVIMPVMQGVRVLATGRDPYREQLDSLNYPQPRSENNFSTVTLDVSPQEAALLTIAIDKGDLLAILRNRNDEGLADFSTVSTQDLFNNAFKMRQAEDERRTRVAEAAGVDNAGNLVDADGKPIMTREQLAAAGLMVNAQGQLIDAQGNVVDPANLVVSATGEILDKAQLAAAGLSVNAAGQIVDENGNVVSAENLVVGSNGEILNTAELAAAGLSVNANGEIVDATGRVIDSSELVKTASGKIMSTAQLEAAGLSVNEKGEIVDASGKVVDPDTLVVTTNGEILSTAQLAAAGLSVNAKGEIVDASGNVVDPANLTVDADGRVVDVATLAAGGRSVDLILGGSPTDGVTKTSVLETAD